jgi:hypothetical protein
MPFPSGTASTSNAVAIGRFRRQIATLSAPSTTDFVTPCSGSVAAVHQAATGVTLDVMAPPAAREELERFPCLKAAEC